MFDTVDDLRGAGAAPADLAPMLADPTTRTLHPRRNLLASSASSNPLISSRVATLLWSLDGRNVLDLCQGPLPTLFSLLRRLGAALHDGPTRAMLEVIHLVTLRVQPVNCPTARAHRLRRRAK